LEKHLLIEMFGKRIQRVQRHLTNRLPIPLKVRYLLPKKDQLTNVI